MRRAPRAARARPAALSWARARARSCALWTGYGSLQRELTVLAVNGVGMSLSLLYMSVFYHYATDRVRRPRRARR